MNKSSLKTTLALLILILIITAVVAVAEFVLFSPGRPVQEVIGKSLFFGVIFGVFFFLADRRRKNS